MAFELGSYFQNFRRYVRSFDPARMHDGGNSSSPVAACSPFAYLGDNDTLPINPCGQIAHSFFNDTFQLEVGGAGGPGGGAGVPLELSESGIAWASDREHLYGAVAAENYNPGGALAGQRGGNTSTELLNQNEHWMVGGGLALRAARSVLQLGACAAAAWDSMLCRPACWCWRAVAGGPDGQPPPSVLSPLLLALLSPAAPAGVDAAGQQGGGTEAVRPHQHGHPSWHQPHSHHKQQIQHV